MKRIEVLLLIIVVVMFSGCASYRAVYDIGLTGIEQPSDAKERYGETKMLTFHPQRSFEDEMVRIVWRPSSYEFLFELTNKTKHSINIIWDEAAYVDEKGMSKRVIHRGVKYVDREKPQVPTTVARGTRVLDEVFPTDSIYWKSEKGGWIEKPLFPNYDNWFSSKRLKTQVGQYVGETVQVLLPIKIEDVVNDYIFLFKIIDATVEEIRY